MDATLRRLFIGGLLGALLGAAACGGGGDSGGGGVAPDSLSAPAGFFRALEDPLCAAMAVCAGDGAEALAGCGYAVDVAAAGGCPAMLRSRALAVVPAAGGYCYFHPADPEFLGTSLATKCLDDLRAIADSAVGCVGPEGAQTACDGVAREFPGTGGSGGTGGEGGSGGTGGVGGSGTGAAGGSGGTGAAGGSGGTGAEGGSGGTGAEGGSGGTGAEGGSGGAGAEGGSGGAGAEGGSGGTGAEGGSGGAGGEGGAPVFFMKAERAMTATGYLALPASCSCVLVPKGAVVPEICTTLAANTEAVRQGLITVGGVCGEP